MYIVAYAGRGAVHRFSSADAAQGNAENVRELVTKLTALVTKRYGAANPAAMHRLFNDYANAQGVVDRVGLRRLLSDAGVGNFLTRGAWVDGVMDHFDPPDATGRRKGGITWEAFQAGTAKKA